jgi:hypothetical protein
VYSTTNMKLFITSKLHHLCFKLPVIVFTLLFAFNKATAQNEDTDFQMNFVKTVHYPDDLKQSCTPAFTSLLIDVSEKGEIQSLTLSDSAPRALMDEFERVKNNLDTRPLVKIIQKRKLRNVGIIIPVFYVYGQDYCTNSFSDFLSNRYLTFGFKACTKLTIVLAPVFVSFYKPVY